MRTQDRTKEATAYAASVQALKLAAEAFHRRHHGTGLNTWDAEAFAACKAAVRDATGEVLGGAGRWVLPL